MPRPGARAHSVAVSFPLGTLPTRVRLPLKTLKNWFSVLNRQKPVRELENTVHGKVTYLIVITAPVSKGGQKNNMYVYGIVVITNYAFSPCSLFKARGVMLGAKYW